MTRSLPRTVSCLALMLGAGLMPAQGATPLPPKAATQVKAGTLAQALGGLQSQGARLGLRGADGFTVEHTYTSAQGRTIVRFGQTYQGHKVWGASAMAEVSPLGQVSVSTPGVLTGINLSGAPALTPAQAVQIAAAKLPQGEQVQGAPAATQVVFATRYTTDAGKVNRNPGQPALYAWAYQVDLQGRGAAGPLSMSYIVDGATGRVLRADDQLAYASPGAPTAPVPSFGTGLGQYSGQVGLSTTQLQDGTYALWDTTRGGPPNPNLLQGEEYDGYGTGTDWNPSGLQVWFEVKDASGNDQYEQELFQKNALTPDFTDAWGDGQVWGGDWVNEALANGQTAGVDALHGMASTWDFYGNVFNWYGLDNLGTSVYAMVLNGGPADTQDYTTDVSSYDYYNNIINLGAGSYPANPAGYLSLADLDIVAHEMAHGVEEHSALMAVGAGIDMEEADLTEGNADFFAIMAKAYSTLGPMDDPGLIPATTFPWTIGAGPGRGTPIRWITRPSKDGISVDYWHDGIAYMDPHYAGGVLSRALMFLAQGASANPADDTYSPFLPDGMTGVGNDHAARIWWKVLTENFVGHVTGSLTFESARSASLGAAFDLYGEGSPEALGVQNAFAAVNVGAAPGQAPATQVVFPAIHTTDWLGTYGAVSWINRQFMPWGEKVTPRVAVLNNANTQVTWTVGGPSMYAGGSASEGGVINPDGSWTIPDGFGVYALTATSAAVPAQFAEGRILAMHMDCDADGENDAMDMGALGFSWDIATGALSDDASVYQEGYVVGCTDEDVAIFLDMLKNAWPAQ